MFIKKTGSNWLYPTKDFKILTILLCYFNWLLKLIFSLQGKNNLWDAKNQRIHGNNRCHWNVPISFVGECSLDKHANRSL